MDRANHIKEIMNTKDLVDASQILSEAKHIVKLLDSFNILRANNKNGEIYDEVDGYNFCSQYTINLMERAQELIEENCGKVKEVPND